MYWVAHPLRPRDFPRPSRCPSGFALGTSLGPREISWSSGMYNPIHPSSRQCTDTFPHRYHGSIDFYTVNINCTLGMDFLIYPRGWINDKRMALWRTLPRVGMYIPLLDSKIDLFYLGRYILCTFAGQEYCQSLAMFWTGHFSLGPVQWWSTSWPHVMSSMRLQDTP